MAKITKEAALLYHSQGKPGKIEVVPTKPYSTQTDLSLAYSPGVAEPCLEIEKNPQDAYKYTAKGNLVAVISNGTAVLGLGDIGALSGKPVMEGKGLLFKIYAGIDVFDIEVNEKDPEKFIEAVKAIAPTFGGINLEDIKAPECFEIERRLKEELDIPVMHDDQHGTAIISSAGLVNALQVAGKKIEDVKIVVNGAGASAVSCTKLYVSLGARLENIVMLDSKGVISKARTDLNEQKRYFATDRTDIHTLEEAIKGADVFLGLSKGNVLSQDMVRSMAPSPIVFALANPTPEISYEDAMSARPDVLMATGRSDYPNQINNVIGFPYIFRGALDTQAKAINEEMKIATVHAIANLAKQPVPDVVNEAYHVNNFSFGPEYFIPKPVDPRLITEVSCAVAKAAMESGVARKNIEDWDAYCVQLRELMGYESKLTRQLYDTARRNPQRVVFAEGSHPNMLKAAVEAKAEGICHPIVLGNDEKIHPLSSKRRNSLPVNGIAATPSTSARRYQVQKVHTSPCSRYADNATNTAAGMIIMINFFILSGFINSYSPVLCFIYQLVYTGNCFFSAVLLFVFPSFFIQNVGDFFLLYKFLQFFFVYCTVNSLCLCCAIISIISRRPRIIWPSHIHHDSRHRYLIDAVFRSQDQIFMRQMFFQPVCQITVHIHADSVPWAIISYDHNKIINTGNGQTDSK